jgi:Fur family transcriptional regulator, iron response regulator
MPAFETHSVAPGIMDRCPVHALRGRLRKANLRPTRQRVALGWLLFAKGDRHVTAEMLHDEARAAKVPVSLATVYNTLHQFTQAGLLAQIAIDSGRVFFDTNIRPHHHFLIEETNALMDIPKGAVVVAKLPDPPEGFETTGFEVIVRLKKRG